MQNEKNANLWEKILQQVQELARECNESADFVFALFWLGNKALVPVFRYDLREEDILASLISISTQEQKRKDMVIDWHKVFMTMVSYMDSSQHDSFLGKFDDLDQWN